MKSMRHFSFVLALSAAVPFAAQAQGDRPDPAVGGYEVEIERAPIGAQTAPSFTQIDADNSGYVDRDEAKLVTGLMFSDADEDDDGKLSRSEFEAAVKVRRENSPGNAEKAR